VKQASGSNSKPATPDHVLRVLVDAHRQQCQFDPAADPDIALTFDTTVADWRAACDLVGWRSLAHSMNDWWHIQRSDEEWRAVLEPASERRLRDVCEFIAEDATMPLLHASRLLGASCHSASAFKAILDALAAAGASVTGLRPSSSLDLFLRRYPQVFLDDISRLAPGALPPVKIRTPIYNAAILGFVLFLVVAGIADRLDASSFVLFCILLAAVCYAMTWIAAKYIGPSSVEFGGLKTFRELAQLVASHRNI
jgi:hypothetical protein